VACMKEESNLYKAFRGLSRRRKTTRCTRRRWEDGIRIDLREVKWIQLAQDTEWWQYLMNAELVNHNLNI
jgi:hypothetical protein